MRFPRSSKWWGRSAMVMLCGAVAAETAFLPGAWALFSIVGVLGILVMYFWRESLSVMFWRKALLPSLFLLGLASFLHFSLLSFWLLQLVVLLSIWIVFELYWKAEVEREDALVYITAFLLGLGCWDLFVRDLGPFWLLLLLFTLAIVLLGTFKLSLFGEPIRLALIFGLFLAINCAEIFFILAFWPVSAPVKAILLLLSFYLQLSLLLAAESGKVTFRKALTPIVITIAASLLIFLTTEWYPFV